MSDINHNSMDLGSKRISATELTSSERSAGLHIARTCEVEMRDGYWLVGAGSAEECFEVSTQQQSCTCSPGQVGVKCRHVFSVEHRLMGVTPSNDHVELTDTHETVEERRPDTKVALVEDPKEAGLVIALTGTVEHVNGIWHVMDNDDEVPFQTDDAKQMCSCSPGVSGSKCRHLYAVEQKLMGAQPPASRTSSENARVNGSSLVSPGDITEAEWLAEEQAYGPIVTGTTKIESLNGVWLVTTDSDDKPLLVDAQRQTCECRPEIVGNKCSHLFAVENHWLFDPFEDVAPVKAKKRRSYPQNWPKYDEAERMIASQFPVLLSQLADMSVQPEHRMGRRQLAVADKIFGCVYKVYYGKGVREFMGYLDTARRAGHVHNVPHYNTFTNFLKKPDTTRMLLELLSLSALPFVPVETKFAIDGSGFSTSRSVTWFNKRYGRITDNREWVKAHIICGVKTNVIVAADVSGWRAHDSLFFEPLVARVSEEFTVEEILGDKAYLSRKNLFLAELVGATPYIPFKENTLPARWDNTMWGMMYRMFMDDLEAFNEHYNMRNNVETTYSMIENRFSKTIQALHSMVQINEVLCMLIAHNIIVLIHEMVEHGVEPDFSTRAA